MTNKNIKQKPQLLTDFNENSKLTPLGFIISIQLARLAVYHSPLQPLDPFSIPRICLFLPSLVILLMLPPRIHFQNMWVQAQSQPCWRTVFHYLSPNFSLTPRHSRRIWTLSIYLSIICKYVHVLSLHLSCQVLEGRDQTILGFLRGLPTGMRKHVIQT